MIIPKFRDLTPEQKKMMCNGCGTKGWNIVLPQWCFRASCDHHDFNYWLGRTEADREKADKQFYEQMIEDAKELYKNAVSKLKWWQKPLRVFYDSLYLVQKSQAWTYYKSVRNFGQFFFEYGKSYKSWADVLVAIYPLDLTEEQKKFL